MASKGNLRADIQMIVQALISAREDVVTMAQLDALLPKREFGSAEIEDVFAALAEHGIHIVE